jgi:hypothetical protein
MKDIGPFVLSLLAGPSFCKVIVQRELKDFLGSVHGDGGVGNLLSRPGEAR